MSGKEMDNRGSKSFICAYMLSNFINVKEQRVDDSCIDIFYIKVYSKVLKTFDHNYYPKKNFNNRRLYSTGVPGASRPGTLINP